ncbi:hypothetical protein WN944_029666 [Citrus x changshan-huyou]|uniref:Uncharacterized protein n=1 Tax=Citrus x changshan-huyou TaxID=2935761 RepID=A0AAP0QC81_9ROSI
MVRQRLVEVVKGGWQRKTTARGRLTDDTKCEGYKASVGAASLRRAGLVTAIRRQGSIGVEQGWMKGSVGDVANSLKRGRSGRRKADNLTLRGCQDCVMSPTMGWGSDSGGTPPPVAVDDMPVAKNAKGVVTSCIF